MMPSQAMGGLFKRQTDYNDDGCYIDAYGYQHCYGSTWDRWARWLVLGLIIFFALLIFFLFSCLSARRRRKLGHQPYRGTGWALGRAPPGHGQAVYNGGGQQQGNYPEQQQQAPYWNNSNAPPPAYGGPPANGYYGNRNDVELQRPDATYGGQNRGTENVYEPPTGPPPPKR